MLEKAEVHLPCFRCNLFKQDHVVGGVGALSVVRGVHSCEISWLDPQPSSESSEYESYMEKTYRIERNRFLQRTYHQPQTQEEYRRLCKNCLRVSYCEMLVNVLTVTY
jgi:hypothetical protein